MVFKHQHHRVSFPSRGRQFSSSILVFKNSSFQRFTNERQLVLLNSDELRSKNREQLIEKLERVIQEKNASILKLEER